MYSLYCLHAPAVFAANYSMELVRPAITALTCDVVFVPAKKEADSISKKRRECLASIQRGGRLLLDAEERVVPVLFYAKGRQNPLYDEERVSRLCIERRQTPSL